jgi:hypothetical protein
MKGMHGKKLIWLFGLVAFVAMGISLAGNAAAQEKKVEENPAGEPEVKVSIKHGTVVLVEGNHLVTRMEDGKLEAIDVPESYRFHMDGKVLTVHELKPGMLITHEEITTSKPTLVKTVDVKEGTIWYVNGPRVIIRDANNKLHDYTIPDWAKVMVDNQPVSVYELRKGMEINTTIVTEETVHYVESESKTTVRHPPTKPEEEAREAAPPATPPETAPPTQAEERPEPAMEKLPGAGSLVPLAGLLGLLSLAASFGLGWLRKEH